MSLVPRRVSLPFFAFVMLVGCSPAVREDRSITFARDGKQVAFQHGRDGIFVAETEGVTPTKIFQPDEDVIAASTPLWSPIDRSLIFTTARDADKDQNGKRGLPAEQDPAGDLHHEKPALYTCWLRTEPKPGQPLNVPLLTVRCGHPGYVAANLAVRWHPDGRHILYIKQFDNGRHGLFEHDLQTKSSRQVFPHTGNSIVFDWAPDHSHLACVLSEKSGMSQTAGIWIGEPGDGEWWHVPESSELGRGDLDDLRAARPVWTNDSARFAFITEREKKDGIPAVHTLHLGSLDTRAVQQITRGDQPIRDLHWRPDGSRLGFLCGGEIGAFHLADPAKKSDRIIGGDKLCNFLGWDAAGEQVAFVARQPLPRDPAKSWAFLFLPDVRARNLVLVAPDRDPGRTRTIFSGLQVTFPRWSPKESKLSLWATFRPSYRSWLSHLPDLRGDAQDPLRGLTLRPGDPALILDPATGARDWKAIDAREETQVGHYHLMHGEYAEAWRWYEQAAAGAPDEEDRSAQQFVKRFIRGRDALFFHAYCLDKLGRDEEARSKRQQFEKTFLPDLPAQAQTPAPRSTRGLRRRRHSADEATAAALAQSVRCRGLSQPGCDRRWRTLLPRRPQGRRVRRRAPEQGFDLDAVPAIPGQARGICETGVGHRAAAPASHLEAVHPDGRRVESDQSCAGLLGRIESSAVVCSRFPVPFARQASARPRAALAETAIVRR
jgi:hypothetical protein